MGPKRATDDFLTEAEEKIMVIAVRLDCALRQRDKHPELVDDECSVGITDDYQYWQIQINKIYVASASEASSTRIHPIVPVVAEEWQASRVENRPLNLDAMSLIEAKDNCRQVARDHPTWPGKLSMVNLPTLLRSQPGDGHWWLPPPPDPPADVPAVVEDDDEDDDPDAPDGSAGIRLRRSSRSSKGKAAVRSDAEPVDGAKVSGMPRDGGGVVPMDEDTDGDGEATPRKPRIYKRQNITSPTTEASAPPKQRQRTNTIGESAAGIIEPLNISADHPTRAEGSGKRRQRKNKVDPNLPPINPDFCGPCGVARLKSCEPQPVIGPPSKKHKTSCINCAFRKVQCSPLATWAKTINDDESSKPKPVRRRTAVAAIVGDVTPSLESLRKTQREHDARLTNMEVTINNIDTMLRALCRVNGINPNNLMLQIPPVPRFDSPIRSTSSASASSAISTASTLSSSVNAQRMSLDDISEPGPSTISRTPSRGRQGPDHSDLSVGKATESAQPTAGPSSTIGQDLDDYVPPSRPKSRADTAGVAQMPSSKPTSRAASRAPSESGSRASSRTRT
ncbi:hypothetical protein EDB84DRAFT_1439666 [Lactarius hengduanensis]|nr:hypothetical protein EDB84DRAFT_1439666 [Lactarius hengduanensis]